MNKVRILITALFDGHEVEVNDAGLGRITIRYFSKGDTFDALDQTFEITESGVFMKCKKTLRNTNNQCLEVPFWLPMTDSLTWMRSLAEAQSVETMALIAANLALNTV